MSYTQHTVACVQKQRIRTSYFHNIN